MRAGFVVVFVLVAAPLGAMAACDSFQEAPDADDGGPDTSTPSGDGSPAMDAMTPATPHDAAVDAGLVSTPGRVECFPTECASTAVCCIDSMSKTICSAPGATCPFGQGTYECDEQADCKPSQHCCLTFFGSSASCQNSCSSDPADDHRLCKTDDECLPGTRCLPLPCRGTLLGVCAPTPDYITKFCNPDAGVDGG